jgi:hypothetical protein
MVLERLNFKTKWSGRHKKKTISRTSEKKGFTPYPAIGIGSTAVVVGLLILSIYIM